MKRLYNIVSITIVMAVMSGCAHSTQRPTQPQTVTPPTQQVDTVAKEGKAPSQDTPPPAPRPKGYIQTLSNVHKKARGDINAAVQGRDSEIADAMKELEK